MNGGHADVDVEPIDMDVCDLSMQMYAAKAATFSQNARAS